MDEILFLQNETEKVYMHDELVKAVRNIVRATRKHPDIVLGASTRSGITFLKCLKAFALVNSRSFVTEEDLQQLTHAVLDHRLIYRSKEGKQKALGGILDREMDKLSKMKVAS
jgi:MoxR-like ATPase